MIKIHTYTCILKSNSKIKKYLDNYKQYPLDPVFKLSDLNKIFQNIFFENNCYAADNPQIVILTKELQDIFHQSVLFLPELDQQLLSHVIHTLNNAGKNKSSELITQDLYVTIPGNILYEDKTSVFWMPEKLNMLLTTKRKISYFWHEILDSLKEYIIKHKETLFIYQDTNIICLLNDPLYAIFEVERLHVAQLEQLLKNQCLFLGKTNTIINSCPELSLEKLKLTDSFIYWLEGILVTHHLPNLINRLSSYVLNEFSKTNNLKLAKSIMAEIQNN